jgi:small subunit ribosomal protein S4
VRDLSNPAFFKKAVTMSKRESAKFKIDRRMGESIWGRPKSPVNKRSYGPGQHGQRRAKKLSDYGTQLQAKQKLKGYYGNITERQFRRYYQEASRRPGDTGENMIGLLEHRLDAVVYRAKFAPTPFSARQIVSHGHVKVNGKRVTIASYQVREGDLIELSAKARDMALVLEAAKSAERDTPDYLEVNDGKSAKFLRTPKLSDVPYAVQMQPHLIVEFYSR